MSLCSFISNTARSQDNTGTEFWLTTFAEGFIDHLPGVYVVGNYDAQVTIDYVARNPANDMAGDPQCTEYTFNLIGGVPQFVNIPYDAQALCFRYFDDYDAVETVQQNGIRVTSTAPIALYSQFFTLNSSEMTSILPVQDMGTDYIVAAHREITNVDNDFNARTTIVAIENNTNVTISLPNYTWTSRIVPDPLGGTMNVISKLPGSTWTVTLNQGETYTFISNDNDQALNQTPSGSSVTVNNNQGLTGVRVSADKRISVLGGTDCTWIGNDEYPGCGACDLTTTHLKPTANWGTRYVTTQTLVRPVQMSAIVGLSGTSPNTTPTPRIEPYPAGYNNMSVADYLLITARNNGTVVNITGRANYTKTLNAGEWFIYESPGISNPLTPPPTTNPGAAHHLITSNSPIQIVQMMKGWQCDNVQAADPSQMLVIEEGKWADNYVVTNPTQYLNNFFVFLIREPNGTNVARNSLNLTAAGTNIPIPNGMSATNDGTNGWTAIGTTGYFFQRINVGVNVALKARSLPATPGGPTYDFGFYASGSSAASSYGYMGGAVCNLEVFAGVSADTFCQGDQVVLSIDSTRNGGTIAGLTNYNYEWTVVDQSGNVVYNFSGLGASANHTFNAVGSGPLTAYVELSDIADCFAQDSVTFYVNPLPDIDDLTDPVSCNSYTFPAITGSQLTGNQAYYSGPNGTGASFLPGSVIQNSGTYYMYDATAADCFDEESIVITVNSSPEVDPASISRVCNPAGTHYQVSFTVTGGTGGPYSVNEIAPGGTGGTWNGNTYTTNDILSAAPYHFEITDANGCTPVLVTGVYNCNCISDAGTMNTQAIATCGNGAQTAAVGSVAPTLDANDVQSFVLHTNSGGTLGNVLATNNNPTFSFNAGNMTYNNTYYISRVVGDDAGSGTVDLLDGCLSVSVGTPAKWNAPIASTINTSTPNICSADNGILNIVTTGPGPFNIVYSNGVSNQNILNATGNQQRSVTPGTTRTYTLLSVTSLTNGCSADFSSGNPSAIIQVHDAPAFSNKQENCNLTNSHYTLRFDVSGTAPFNVNPLAPSGLSGVFSGNTWTSDPIPSNTPYQLNLSDQYACGITTVSGSKTCACVSDAGAMQRAQTLSACSGETITAQADQSVPTFLDPNDVLGYVLHDQGGSTLGTIIARNSTPSFGFTPATMNVDQVYYISAVVGNDNGSGQVDLNDPCLSVAFGAPVVWRMEPDLSLNYNGPLCSGTGLQLFATENNGIANVQYTWVNDSGYVSNQKNPVVANVSTSFNGMMTLTASNQGCVVSEQINLTVHQSATANFQSTSFTGNNNEHFYDFINLSANANAYIWNFGDGRTSAEINPSHEYDYQSQPYDVMLVAVGENACNDTMIRSVLLEFRPDTVLVFAPNAFTPDGNEFNQEFKPIFNESVNEYKYSMQVFNRWGEMVFETFDVNVGWDGTYQNMKSPSGIYTYVIRFKDKNTEKAYRSDGTISLLR